MRPTELKDKLIREYGQGLLNGSILQDHGNNDVEVLSTILDQYSPFDTSIEIGTKHGVGAVTLAQYSKRVITFDINEPKKTDLWAGLPIEWRKVERTVNLSDLSYDFVLIDGDHSYEQIERDYYAITRPTLVLFHDYGTTKHPGVTKFVDTLDAIILPPYALVRKEQ